MKGTIHGLSALLIAIAVASSGCKRIDNDDKPAQKASSHIERAESYRKQGQYRAAIIEARNAIDAAPQDTRGTIELATLLNELNQGKQALRILEPLASSTDHAVVIARTDALLTQGKSRSALEYLQAHNSNTPDIQVRIAQAQAGLGLIDEAQATFTALENSSEATTAKLQKAHLHLQQGNTAAANEELEQLLQKDPNLVDALALSAKLAEMQGNLESAEALLSRALINLPQTDIITPSKTTVLQQLIPILTKLGRSSESLVYAKALADADPQGNILQDKFKQGLDAFKAGKLDEAEGLLKEVYEQTHDDYAGLLLGMIKYNKKDFIGAANYLGENADPEVAPDTALKALANAELRLGQPDKLLELIGPEEREHIKDPELKALVGIALVQSGNNASGEKMLADALQNNPANASVRAILARHYLISNQTDKAIKTLEEGLAQKADNGLARLLIGAYVQAEKLDAALRAAQTLAATTPEQSANYHLLGHTALIAKQYPIAEKALQKSLALQPDYAPALLDSAQLHLIRQQAQPALDIYQKLIAANADDIAAIKGFITAQEMLGKKSDNDIENKVSALASSETARAVVAEYYLRNQRDDDANRLLSTINVVPGNNYLSYVKQLYALSEANRLLKAKEFNRASQTALEGLRLNPRNTNLLALLGHTAIASGATKEASKIIEQFALIEPKALALVDLRASLAIATGDTSAAIEQLRSIWNAAHTDQAGNKLYQALAKTNPQAATQFLAEWQAALPNSDSPLLLRAVQYERDGDTQQAQKLYEAALSHNANNALTLNNLAMIYFAKNDSRAITLAEQAYKLQPQNPAVLDTYGWILVGSKQREKGITLLQQAAALAPDVPEIADHLKRAQAP